jgi:hypothetical protein
MQHLQLGKGKNDVGHLVFLFQDGANVLAYLNMENHKSFNTTRI